MQQPASNHGRSAERRRLEVTAQIRERGAGGLPLPLDLLEVSESGAFIDSDLLLPVGLELDLRFDIPGGHSVAAGGRVVRVDDQRGSAGMGLQFDQLSKVDRAILRRFTRPE